MSREPVRLKDASGAHPLARELLRSARRTSPMPAASHVRGARRVRQLALIPAIAAGVSLWSKAVAAAFGLGFTSAIALVAVVPAVRDALSEPRPPDPRAVTPFPRAAAQANARPPAIDEPSASAGPERDAPTLDAGRTITPASPTAAKPRTARNAPASTPEVAETSLPAVAPPLALERLAPPPVVDTPRTVDREAYDPNPALAAEVQLLAHARQLTHSEPARALALLQRHAREFPTGSLSLEREVLVIESLHRSGERDRAAERARHLLSRAPGALYAARLRALLGTTR